MWFPFSHRVEEMCGKCGLINGKCLFFLAASPKCDMGRLCSISLHFFTFLKVLFPAVLMWIKIPTYQELFHYLYNFTAIFLVQSKY